MMEVADLLAVALLVFLEGVLSVDNAVVLAVLVKPLPKSMQKKALTYGMAGAFGFRIIALSLVTYLAQMWWIKVAGGLYLVQLAVRHFLNDADEEHRPEATAATFWRTILVVELTDIAFSADSILAAMAVSSKLWVICAGGILGIVMMRFAATVFVKLLEKYPKLEDTAYHLVLLIGTKLNLEAAGVNFHHGAWFWTFWGAMAGVVAYGAAQSHIQGSRISQSVG